MTMLPNSLPVLPDSAPFAPEQRAWLNGYMAGLLSRREIAPEGEASPAAKKEPLAILFGTQTGTAEMVAKRVAKRAGDLGFAARVIDMAQFTTVTWANEPNLLIVTSTYGEGEMPDNAQAFWEFLKADSAPRLETTRFSVFALGDTNYPDFCSAGKNFDARLEQLGAKRVHARADADVDYEAAFTTWLEAALTALAGTQVQARSEAAAVVASAPLAAVGTKKNPFLARLVGRRLLNQNGSEKETYHHEISLVDSPMTYEVGDALGVIPTNNAALADEMIALLGASAGDEVKAPDGTGVTLRDALITHYDITKIPKPLLETIAKRCGDADLAALLAPEQSDALKKWLWGREIIDLLVLDAKKSLTLVEFISLLRPLQPRLYSISSSIKAHPGQVHLTVAAVKYATQGRSRQGVCSTFLSDRVELEKTPVPVFHQASHGFRLPTDLTKPVIMVGPGTGIAPFRAFLEERQVTGATGKNWLFFGEQRAATDFYYREELEKMQSAGVLTQLTTAFSRDQKEKIYVQHRMLEAAPELWAWLEDGAYFYVCGDASRMAKDVDAALHAVVEKAGGRSTEEAAAYLAALKTQKRYLRDVY